MKPKNIQRTAKVLLSLLLTNAMFTLPATHASKKTDTTDNIKLDRVLPHYEVESRSLNHLLLSYNNFHFGAADHDTLKNSYGALGHPQTPIFYFPSDGFLRIGDKLPRLWQIDLRKDPIEPLSETSDISSDSHYAAIMMHRHTLSISLYGISSDSDGNGIMRSSDNPITFDRGSAYNVAKSDWESDGSSQFHPLEGMKYHVHNAIVTPHKGKITLYPYEVTRACSKKEDSGYRHTKRIPVNKQKYYPLTLTLVSRHSVESTRHLTSVKAERAKAKKAQRNKIKKQRRKAQKHRKERKQRHEPREIKSGDAPE